MVGGRGKPLNKGPENGKLRPLHYIRADGAESPPDSSNALSNRVFAIKS